MSQQADIRCTACGARYHNPDCNYCRDNVPDEPRDDDDTTEPPTPTTPE